MHLLRDSRKHLDGFGAYGGRGKRQLQQSRRGRPDSSLNSTSSRREEDLAREHGVAQPSRSTFLSPLLESSCTASRRGETVRRRDNVEPDVSGGARGCELLPKMPPLTDDTIAGIAMNRGSQRWVLLFMREISGCRGSLTNGSSGVVDHEEMEPEAQDSELALLARLAGGPRRRSTGSSDNVPIRPGAGLGDEPLIEGDTADWGLWGLFGA
jgi:hypothetical protein